MMLLSIYLLPIVDVNIMFVVLLQNEFYYLFNIKFVTGS